MSTLDWLDEYERMAGTGSALSDVSNAVFIAREAPALVRHWQPAEREPVGAAEPPPVPEPQVWPPLLESANSPRAPEIELVPDPIAAQPLLPPVQEVELGAPVRAPEFEFEAPIRVQQTLRKPTGQIAALRSVSAGCGRTVLAANLAFEIAALGRSVCLVDLDHLHPSQHRYFGIASPKAAVLAGVRYLEQGRFGAAAIDELKLRLVSKGVSVDLFAGVGLPENLAATEPAAIEALLEQLAANYQFVVVDTGGGLVSALTPVLDNCATQTLWVTLPDALSMGRFLDAQSGIAGAKTSAEQRLVVNRLRASVLGARPDWQVQQLLRDRTALQLASMVVEDQALDQAMLQGLPLRQAAPRSKALAAVNQLASRLA